MPSIRFTVDPDHFPFGSRPLDPSAGRVPSGAVVVLVRGLNLRGLTPTSQGWGGPIERFPDDGVAADASP